MTDQSQDPYKQIPIAFKGNSKVYYDAVINKYELSEEEIIILHNICHQIMLVEDLRFQLAQQDFIVIGVGGMDKANPLLAEIARHSTLMLQHIKQLNLPTADENGNLVIKGPESISAHMREMGKKRWAQRAS